jgi:hypothetical protein
VCRVYFASLRPVSSIATGVSVRLCAGSAGDTPLLRCDQAPIKSLRQSFACSAGGTTRSSHDRSRTAKKRANPLGMKIVT